MLSSASRPSSHDISTRCEQFVRETTQRSIHIMTNTHQGWGGGGGGGERVGRGRKVSSETIKVSFGSIFNLQFKVCLDNWLMLRSLAAVRMVHRVGSVKNRTPTKMYTTEIIDVHPNSNPNLEVTTWKRQLWKRQLGRDNV